MIAPREAKPTVQFIDTYAEMYRDLFVEVRAYENFKYIIMGMLSEIKRKSLPAIARAVGLENEQGLLHFLTESPWSAEELELKRLRIILEVLQGAEIEVIIDETGDKKKGKKTDYVKRQYIGNLGKIENGIVSVNAYGHYQGMIFPLKFKIYKPSERLKKGEKYKTKPEIAIEIIKELQALGFRIGKILADSLYGESASKFMATVEELGIEYAVSIRSNHGVWLPATAKVRVNKWRVFENQVSDEKIEKRYIREIIYGKRQDRQYWEISKDKENDNPENSWYVMTKIPNLKYNDVGNIYKIRSGVEHGFRNSKSELGWADFRVTNYSQIQKWWELVMSAYLLVCLHSDSFNPLVIPTPEIYQKHDWFDLGQGWKNHLNNIRLILSPCICFNAINKWLKVFPINHLSLGFAKLIGLMNQLDPLDDFVNIVEPVFFSSA
ncbi:MAG: IS701 family transposase [Microcoleaceae cyanobacterium]